MIAAIVIPLLGLAVLALVGLSLPRAERGTITQILMVGYGIRLVLFEAVMRRVAFFSHGVAGGDCQLYERYGSLIAMRWRYEGIHFVTEHDMPQVGNAALPCNILGFLEYLNGAPAPLAGTAVNAFLACWTALIIYRFARDNAVESPIATRVMLLVFFGPSFLYHTSDTYKDGLNAFLVISSVVSAVRLAQQFSPTRLLSLATSLFLLWFVRHYMVFMCLAPLALGFLGVGKASLLRRTAAALMLLVLVVAAVYSGSAGSAVSYAEHTYSYATDANTLNYNAESQRAGSGVVTDSYLLRLVYTLFAPFPWQLGSFGMQLGKIESLIFYWFMYQVYSNRARLVAQHRAIVLMLASFIGPATLVYATTMSNVGLITRQRMPIVIATAILAALGLRHARSDSLAEPRGPNPGFRTPQPE